MIYIFIAFNFSFPLLFLSSYFKLNDKRVGRKKEKTIKSDILRIFIKTIRRYIYNGIFELSILFLTIL